MTKNSSVTQPLREWMEISTHRSMHEWTRFAKSTGLSMPQFGILMQLHHRGPCGMSEISGRFDVTAAAASQLVDKLVQGGYLERAEDPNDRRARLLRLTAQGEKLVKDGIQERYRWLDELVSTLNADECAKAAEALSILAEKAKQINA